jgi:dihydrofolate synthase / folylpolyglutamate synthase
MTYEQAMEYIHGTLKFGSKLGLHNITALLELMGDPHRKLRFIHVAGTNGKGSTVAYISSILIEAGYKVGIFTSPYLERFSERMKVNHAEIPEETLARIAGFVKSKVDILLSHGESHPTEFEIVTAIAFQYYYEQECDVVVLEVGLGGRYDSTNVIDTPLLAVITTISYDHMSILGDTLPKIAFEKAGIIKSQGDVLLYPQPQEVDKVFETVCMEKQSRLLRVDFDTLQIRIFDVDSQTFDYGAYKNLQIGLLGEHQVRNAVVALHVSEILRSKGLSISENAVREGLRKARWPGRLEVLHKSPLFLIDGAHNAEGARILSDALCKYFPNKKITFILGVLKDKEIQPILEAVVPHAARFITVTPKSERALAAEELGIFVKSYCNDVIISDTIEEAIGISLQISTKDDIICAFGSLYYIGEARKYFKMN